jgi:hypothetical protein
MYVGGKIAASSDILFSKHHFEARGWQASYQLSISAPVASVYGEAAELR